MNFTQEIKDEIVSKKRYSNEEIYEFLRGLVYAKGIIENDIVSLRINTSEFRNVVVKYFEKVKINLTVKNSQLSFNVSELPLEEKFLNPSAFYQGVFFGSGSISNLSKSSYHLQICSNYEKFIDVIMNKLNEYDFNFIRYERNSKYVIYIKKFEKISDFLKAISVSNSLFKFIDNTINRDFNNNINRLNNIDLSNIQKSINANNKHISNIKFIYDKHLEKHFSKEQLKMFEIIVNNPEESLNSLVNIFNENNEKPITKSGLYHWLTKLSQIVKKNI